jgi:hypothetical protein
MNDFGKIFEEQEHPEDGNIELKDVLLEEVPAEEKAEEKPSRRNYNKKVDVQRIIAAPVEGKWLVQKVGEENRAYLVPIETFERSHAVKVQTVSLDILEEVYDFAEEIEHMLPSREEMVQNVRRALWEAGYTTKERLAAKQPNMGVLNRAFPYTFRFVTISES